jgi:putative peptide zinc metalloprotease protein
MLATELPKLRDDLRVSQQATPQGPVFILKDPVTDRFFRFREAEHFIAQQLDGATPPEAIARRVEEKFKTPLQPDAVQAFLDHLKRLGLLESAEKHQQPVSRQRRVLGDMFYLRFKAFDPDRLFNRLVKTVRFCFTPSFLIGSAAFILFAFGLVIANSQEIGRDLPGLYRIETLIMVWFTILAVTTLHEFAHGLTCKHFGGEVHELGFLLLYFQPAFYCNVSDAWLFPEKSKRLWVSFAGAYCELCLWALATLIWRMTEPGNWPHSAALVVMTTSAVRSLFNMNPLIKLDGYYLLSDALDIPNLRSRSFRYLRGALARTLFRSTGPLAQEALQATPRERTIYLIYSLLAGAFTTWLLGSFALWVGGVLTKQYQALGFFLFAGLLTGVFRHQLKRFATAAIGWFRTVPAQIAAMKRPVRSGLLLTALLLAFVLVRLELTVSGEFTVLPVQNADVRAEVEGIIEAVFVDEGDRVQKGDLIATLADRDYRAELHKTEAQIGERQARLRMLKVGARPEEIEIARNAVVTAKTRQEQARKRYDEAVRLRAERKARVEATVQKSQERARYAHQNFERFKALHEKGFVSRKESDEIEEQKIVREKELEEAQASLKQVLVDDLSDFQKELAVTAKELEESQSRLRLLLAGSREEEIESTEAEIARLETQRRYLDEQLRLMHVVSPHAGVITTPRVKEKIGQLVAKGDLIVEVHDLRTIDAEIAVPEQEIGDVQVGQRVVLKARAYPTESFEGTVTAVAPVAMKPDEQLDQKIIRVITKIDNESFLLKSQMSGNGKVYCGKRPMIELLTRRLVRYLRVEFWAWW